MRKIISKIAGLMLGLSLAAGVGVVVSSKSNIGEAKAAPTGAITSYSSITAGDYYIGATTGGTNYYLSVNGSSTTTSIAGTAVTSSSSATIFTFAGSGTSWSIKFKNYSNYLSLSSSKDNGKVQVVSSAATFTASNQSSLIRLSIGSYSIQKNNSGTQFGSYGNSQTDLWLLPASGGGSFTPTHAGTEIDPYSGADAYGIASELSSGSVTPSSYYIQGMVQSFEETFNPTYGNYSFKIEDNFICWRLKKGSSQVKFNTGDIEIGDTVLMYCKIQNYNGKPETKEGYVVSVTKPTVETTWTVTFDGNGGTSPSSKQVGEGLSFTFESAGSVANRIFKGWSSDSGATFFQVGETSPAVNADITYTAYWSEKGTVSSPYSIVEAKAAIDGNYGLVDAHVSGKVSQVDSFNDQFSSITYWISDDGTTNNQLEVYSGKGIGGAAFSAIGDVEVGATVVVTGTLKKHNSIYEFDKNNQLVSYTAPAAPELVSIAFSGSMTKTSYTTLEAWDPTGLTVTATYTAGDPVNVTSSVEWSFYDSNDVEKATPSAFGEATNQTLKIKATYGGENCVTTATVSVEVVEFDGYVKVTSAAGLVVGDSYVLGCENTNHDTDLMGAAKDESTTAFRNKVDASTAFNSEKTQVTASGAATAGAVVVTLLSDGDGKFAFYDVTNDKYLAGTASGGYFINNTSLADAGSYAWWTISFANGLMSVTLNGSTRVLGYNNQSPRFATYSSYADSTSATQGTAHPVLFRMEGSSVVTSATSFANTSLKMNDSAYEGDIETEYCAANYSAMKEAYVELSDAVKNIFQYSSMFSAARARLLKWAAANGEHFVYGSATPFVAGANSGINYNNPNSNAFTIIIVVVELTSITSIGVLLVIKRKRSLVK